MYLVDFYWKADHSSTNQNVLAPNCTLGSEGNVSTGMELRNGSSSSAVRCWGGGVRGMRVGRTVG